MSKKILALGGKLSAFSLALSPVLLAVLIVLVQIILQFFLFGENLTTGKGPGPTEHFACFVPGNGWTNCGLTGLFLNLMFSFFFAFPVFFMALMASFFTPELHSAVSLGSLVMMIVVVYMALMVESKFFPQLHKTAKRRLHILFVLVSALLFLVGILWPWHEEILDIITV